MITGNDVKKYLKSHGIDTKKISVRIAYGGYSESVNVTIKDLAINMFEVNKLVKREYQDITYDDHAQGEILQGGNTFVFVKYDEDAKEQAILKRFAKAKEMYHEITQHTAYVGTDVFENEEIRAVLFPMANIVSLVSKKDDLWVNQKVHVECAYDLAETLTYLENGLYETQKKETFCS